MLLNWRVEKGLKGVLPENQSVNPKHIITLSKDIRNGSW